MAKQYSQVPKPKRNKYPLFGLFRGTNVFCQSIARPKFNSLSNQFEIIKSVFVLTDLFQIHTITNLEVAAQNVVTDSSLQEAILAEHNTPRVYAGLDELTWSTDLGLLHFCISKTIKSFVFQIHFIQF